MVPNSNESPYMPSYVAFPPNGGVLIGAKAKEQLATNPENTIFDLTRLIGLDFNDPALQTEIKTLPYKVIDKNNKPFIQVNTKHGVKELALEQASSIILKELKKKAEAHLGERVTHAIVTVPANFNDAQRRATMDAAAIANLKISRIINESTAAVVGSNLNKNDGKANVLVYKLGGGTFEVRLMTVNGNEVNVIASGGNTHLGGKDFDQRVGEYFINLYKNETGRNMRNDKIAIQKLRMQVEQAKRLLSYSQKACVKIEPSSIFQRSLIFRANINSSIFKKTLTRTKFEELNMDLFQTTIDTVRSVLKDARMDKKDVDKIILAGGSTQIPKIRQLLKEFFKGKEMIITSKEKTALGAAKQAAILSGEADPKTVLLSEVSSLSLGVDIVKKSLGSGFMSVIIPRNTTIPTKKSGNYTTIYDYQIYVNVKVYEGEHIMVRDNHLLDEYKLNRITLASACVPKLEFTMEIDRNGIINVTARDKGNVSKNSITIDNYRKRFGRADIDRMIKEVEQISK